MSNPWASKLFILPAINNILYWEYVITFLTRNLTRLLFYISNDSKARMKYSIFKSCILIAHFVAFLWIYQSKRKTLEILG